MKLTTSYTDSLVTEALLAGQLVVLRTDTIYGIVALASQEAGVERVYSAKKRSPDKPCILLVPDYSYLPQTISPEERKAVIQTASTQPTSIAVSVTDQPDWLTRGGHSLAFRVPQHPALRKLIEQVGPLIAPSANPEGQPPARTIDEAANYFNDSATVYIDGGIVPSSVQPSRLLVYNQQTHTFDRRR